MVISKCLTKNLSLIDNIIYSDFILLNGSSDCKESVCNEGDHGSIPGSRRSPGEGNGNPL